MKFKSTSHIQKIIIGGISLFLLLIAVSATFFLSSHSNHKSNFTIEHLRTCHLGNPIGIDEATPTFSWQMKGDEQGLSQSAYRITAAASRDDLAKGIYLWDSGKVTGSKSVGIPWESKPLDPKSRYYWQVTVWDQKDRCYTSAEEAYFETGLMGCGMKDAKWISMAEREKDKVYSENDYIYSIHYDMEVSNTAASFVFGAQDGRYGDMYLCRISNNNEQSLFELLKMNDGAFANQGEPLETIDITAFCKENSSTFTVDLQIDHEFMEIVINGSNAGFFSIESTPLAAIGYYKSRGSSYAYLDNLLILDSSNNILYQDEFEAADNIFSPYYVATKDGRLKIGSGLMLTKYYEDPAPLFYREFSLENKEIESARVYMTALGSFSLICNGQRISDDYFAPGKLAYNSELTYMTYDITSLLHHGDKNALGIILLHGWYDRAVGYPETWNPWGNKNALLGMMEIRYKDGTVETIVTDESFLCSSDGPVRMDDIYQGEYYDATLEQEGFGSPSFSCTNWQPAAVDSVGPACSSVPLIGKENEPVRCIAELTPLSVSEPSENVFVYDFGQNFAGTCNITVTGEKGQIITLRYGEALNTENMDNCDDAFGTVWTENLLTAEATDYYVLKGSSEGETFEPEFTYHGFRYLQISGLEEPLPLEDVKGIVLSSDLEQTGSFECSNELLNQFYENTIWSQKSNFMDNPTDCPQRDERHGWAGDAQIYSLTASYHMDTYNFYRKYLNELRLLQSEGGSFPDMAPRNFGETKWDGSGGNSSNNCWGDAAMVITWNLYTQYGDRTILEENYDALCKWMEVLVNTSDNYIRNWGGYGDHLSLEDTPSDLSDTAWCAHSAALLSKIAAALDKEEDAGYYQQIFEKYKEAWQEAYVQSDGTTICDTQTSYALGLAFDLFPDHLREAAANRLNVLAEYSGYHIHTGFSGIAYLLPALSEYGLTETAYSLFLQEEYPSLLYPVKHGATTVYEQLSGYAETENGYFHLDGSFNHYTFGTPAGWLYTNVLGIKSDENNPGYHHIILEPEVGGGLTYAKGSYNSIYGKISVAWERTESGYNFDIKIPPNTTATLTLPDSVSRKKVYELTSGSYHFTSDCP